MDLGATPLIYQPADCPAQMLALNKSGALFVFSRITSDIAAGPLQRIEVAQTSENGDLIGLPAYDPVSEQLYLSTPADDISGKYPHGLLAFGVSSNCMLTLQWQQTIGFDAGQVANNPMIPPVAANGVVYYSINSASSVHAYSSHGSHL